jgi:hypothetical protein
MNKDCGGTVEALQRAFSLGPASQAYVNALGNDPAFNNCRGDQRFQALLSGGPGLVIPLGTPAPAR